MLRYTVMALVTGFIMLAFTAVLMLLGKELEYDQWITAIIIVVAIIMFSILAGCVYYYKPRK